MLPFTETGSRVKDDFSTLKALCRGRYLIDTDRTIDKMAKNLSEQEHAFVCSYISGAATLRQILKVINRVQADVENGTDNLMLHADEIANCRETLYVTAHNTIWRLCCDAITAAALLALGIAMLVVGQTVAGLVALVSAAAFCLAFAGELDARSAELNDQFSYLYYICQGAARETVDLVLLSHNVEYLCSVVERRYGDCLGRSSTDDDLDEPYDPDVELPYDTDGTAR